MARIPKITWNGYNINRVKSFKHLGIHVDDLLNWLEHINKQGEKAIKMQQSLKRIAGGNWGISQIHRRTLYKTVIGRMLAHGSSAWCLNPAYKMKRKHSLRFKGHSYSTYWELIGNGSFTNDTRHPTPTHAIIIGSQVYINLSTKNLSSL
ncbi:hypothetical protein AVEN_107149-1 [Araneus ventricosus]|uniref:Uncharacterized protein n=1 Tax=Araneus ventricosus TaxID=182803 RepID=A0A4Y2I5T6_ARAVE|nr:hypothetical protein AVEN_107149-1 [Araneus ventricosus]